jgi:hypothetical protein
LPEPDGPKIASGRVALGLLQERLGPLPQLYERMGMRSNGITRSALLSARGSTACLRLLDSAEIEKPHVLIAFPITAVTTGSRQGPQGGTFWQAFGVGLPSIMPPRPYRLHVQQPLPRCS